MEPATSKPMVAFPPDGDRVRGYPVRREVWSIRGRRFDLCWPADMDALLDDPETQRRNAADDYMPYWAQPWPGSILLAEIILDGAPGEGRTAIELGAGIGIASLAAAMMGWAVTTTDYDADAIAFAELNAQRTGVTLAGTALLDYRVPPEQAWQLVLGSDLLYERKKCEPVARWIAAGLHAEGMALLSDPNRGAADDFPERCARLGLSCEMLPVESISPAGLQIRGRIWRVRHGG
jgi:predicted nicotinamide N-methyase